AGTTSAGYNGDGDAAVVSPLYSPGSVWTDGNGDVYIADRSNQRIRKVTTATGKISTIIGSGTAGYGGDSGGGRGIVIRAEVASGGPNYLAGEAVVQVQQSSWLIDSYGTSQSTTSNFTYRVRQSNSDRMAAETTFTPTATAPVTLAMLTIANNGTSVTGTATPTGSSGSGRITIPTVGTSFTGTSSDVIIVLAPALSALQINDDPGARIDAATGVRRRQSVVLPATAGGSGVTVNLSVVPAGSVKIGRCNATSATSASCTGETLADTLSLTIPSGSNRAYFDVAGQSAAFTDARLYEPYGVHVDGSGNVYVADRSNYRIRKLSVGGVLTTFAGTGSSTQTTVGSGQQATATTGILSRGITSDTGGNIYIADEDSHVILRVDKTTGVITVAAGTLNSAGNSSSQLYAPFAVAVGADGTLYVANNGYATIRKVVGGVISTLAGGGAATGTDAQKADFNDVRGVALDAATNDVYVSDHTAHKIWRVDQSTGAIELVAGTGTADFNGDQADAKQATLNYPLQLHIRGDYLYIADQNNHRIRRVNIRQTPRPIETIAGTTSAGYNGDGDAAVVSPLYSPGSVWTDGNG
ncbi:MAG: hypothetical protein HYU27_09355, partial [Acidobacteria bacterium]|nr:hypothetical protein [Acidobacteriota bacterium]